MKLFANAFVIAFLLDGVLSLADDTLMVTAGARFLAIPRGLVSGTVLLASIPVYMLLGATPRLPWRVFLPPCLFLTWLGMGAMPLPVWLGLGGALLATSFLKLCMAGAVIFGVWKATGGKSWLFTDASLAGPGFSWRTATAFTALNLFVILPVSVAYLLGVVSLGVDHATAGFLRMRLDGLYAADRAYARGDQTIHLIGMMHIGESSYYSGLIDSFPSEGAIILAEGVSDDQNLLPGGLSYERLAATLGLEVQAALGEEQHNVTNADVDISVFSPSTLRILEASSELLASESMLEALAAYSRLVEMKPDAEMLELLRHDLLEVRNDELFRHIDDALGEYDRIIVPWGALHMAGIESMVLEAGFTLVESREWQILSF